MSLGPEESPLTVGADPDKGIIRLEHYETYFC